VSVEAEVETEDGVFKEVGDASPESVNRAIQPHLLRMAAKQGQKARAMKKIAVGYRHGSLRRAWRCDPSGRCPPSLTILRIWSSPSASISENPLEQVVRQDPGYVAWLAENARDEGVKQAARSVLEQQAAVEPGDFPEVSIERPPAH